MVKLCSTLLALALGHESLAASIGSKGSKTPRQRAGELLRQMTFEEKVGQMGGVRRLLKLGPEVDEENLDEIHGLQNGNLGFGSAYSWADEVLPIANETRRKQINESRLHIPYITVTDSANGLFISGRTPFTKRTDGEFFAHADPGLQQQLLDAVLDSGVPTVVILSGGQTFPARRWCRLVRFVKVNLAPGESKEVEFTIRHEDLGYYVNTRLKVQPGLCNFWVGSSSRVEDLKAVNVILAL